MTKQQLLQVGGNCLILGHSGDTRASRATHRRQLPGPPWALRSACQATQPRGRRLARDQPHSLRWAPVGTRGSPRCGGARERGSRAGPHRHSCLHAGQRTRATAQSAHSVGLPGQGTPLAPSGAGGPRPARPACSMAQSQAPGTVPSLSPQLYLENSDSSPNKLISAGGGSIVAMFEGADKPTLSVPQAPRTARRPQEISRWGYAVAQWGVADEAPSQGLPHTELALPIHRGPGCPGRTGPARRTLWRVPAVA